MKALDAQNDRIAEYLLRQGASPFVQNKYGEIASELTPVSSMIY